MPKKSNPLRIVVLQRGWIIIGRHSATKDTTLVENAAVVRRWGTTKGLGELASLGKRPNTVLDECPSVRAPTLAVIMTMDCDAKAWADRP